MAISVAVSQWDLVVWQQAGKTYLSLQGPDAKASTAPVPQHAEFFGILFKTGVFMPHLPVSRFIGRSLELPNAANHRFWLRDAGLGSLPGTAAEILDDEVRAIRDGGGFGSIIGRNSFQRKKPDALKFLGTVMGIYGGTQK